MIGILVEVQKELIELTDNGWYAQQYVKYEKTYWPDILIWLSEDFGGKQNLKCLDVGCGYGTLLIYCQKLLGSKPYCINDSMGFLGKGVIKKYDIVSAHKNIELDEFPFEEKFEIMIMTAVLEHFNFHPLPTLKKLRSHLAEGGIFYLSVPDSASKEWGKLTKYFKSVDEMPMPKRELYIDGGHHYHYTDAELTKLLDDAGFKILRKTCSYGIFNIALGLK